MTELEKMMYGYVFGLLTMIAFVFVMVSKDNRDEKIKSQDELIQVQDTLIVNYEDIIIMQSVFINNKCQ